MKKPNKPKQTHKGFSWYFVNCSHRGRHKPMSLHCCLLPRGSFWHMSLMNFINSLAVNRPVPPAWLGTYEWYCFTWASLTGSGFGMIWHFESELCHFFQYAGVKWERSCNIAVVVPKPELAGENTPWKLSIWGLNSVTSITVSSL